MGDIYGISNSVAEANALHGQVELQREQAAQDFQTKLGKFHDAIKTQKKDDQQVNDRSELSDAGSVSKVYNIGNATVQGLKGAVSGVASNIAGREATQAAQVASRNLARVGPVASQSAFLAESGAAARGESVAAGAGEAASGVGEAALGLGQRAVNLASSAGRGAVNLASSAGEAGSKFASGVGAAGSGFLSGAREAGGVATTIAEQMRPGGLAGVEGIAQKVVGTLKGGDALAFGAGKIAGAAGGLITGGQQIDSLIETGGKSAFTRTDASGNQVKLSKTDDVGEILTEAGTVADLAAAASGGLFVPFAAAISLAGAAVTTIGGIEDDKADNKKVGINPDGTTDTSAAPKPAAAPISEAFSSLGFLGSQTHNPLLHV
tara:strand:- start:2357 stop:3490 length:1134 start_codon:yes stop_codon:yes gene_type:complete